MQEKLPGQCAAHSRHSTNFIPAPAHPPGEESMPVSGTGMVQAGGNPFSPPPPGGSRPPICCPRCIPIRRISQPGGSGYRRLNDKVPPLPARPPRTRRDALWFQRARSAPALEELGARGAHSRPAEPRGGGESRRGCRRQTLRGSTSPRPQGLHAQLSSCLASPPLGGHSLRPRSGARPPLRDPHDYCPPQSHLPPPSRWKSASHPRRLPAKVPAVTPKPSDEATGIHR